MIRSKRALLATALLLAIDVSAWAGEVSGHLAWARRVSLSVPVSGVVSEVAARPGERVAAGASLLKLDARGYSARATAAKARVEGLRDAHEEAQRELDRAQELYERMLLSDHEMVEAKIAFGKADSDFRAAEAAQVQAEMALQYSEIRAPFDAWVVARHAEVGQTVAVELQSVPLVELAEAGRMAVNARVNAAQLAKLALGDKVSVKAAGQTFAGAVSALGTEPVSETKEGVLYTLQVMFDSGKRLLRPGQPATVILP